MSEFTIARVLLAAGEECGGPALGKELEAAGHEVVRDAHEGDLDRKLSE
jgi:hypothetical protein